MMVLHFFSTLLLHLAFLAVQHPQVLASPEISFPANATSFSNQTTTTTETIIIPATRTTTIVVTIPTTTATPSQDSETTTESLTQGSDTITSAPRASDTTPVSPLPVSNGSITGTITVEEGAVKILALPEYPEERTVTLTGPTTFIDTIDIGLRASGYASIRTVPLLTTFTFTTTLTETGGVWLQYVGAGTLLQVSVNGPTTYTGTYTGRYTDIFTERVYVGTYTETVGSGTIVVAEPSGQTYVPVTLVGPTTYVGTYSARAGAYPRAGINTEDPHCNRSATATNNPGQYVTYAQQMTILTDHQTITAAVAEAASIDPKMMNGYVYNTVTKTFVGPTTVFTTQIAHLYANMEQHDIGPGDAAPGEACGGRCGYCFLFFPTVSVHYWPVAQPNTACLNAIDSATAAVHGNSTADGGTVQPRGLSDIVAAGSTMVNSEGFTFTSPSVYIAFPTISAYDNCGQVGKVHTSTTLAFAPEEMSTVVFFQDSTIYKPFNFADAHCPPSDLQGNETYSIVGQTGYNPIISPPARITDIDPAWIQLCRAAAFQGNDPPYALAPAGNPDPSPTHVDPIVTATPASPSSAIPAIPVKTDPPIDSVVAWTPQPATSPVIDPKPSVAPNDPPPALPAAQDPKDPINNPAPAPHSSPSAEPPDATPNDPAPAPQDSPAAQAPKDQPNNLAPIPQNTAAAPNANDPSNGPAPAPQSNPTAEDPKDPPSNPATLVNNPIVMNSLSALQVGSQTLTPGGAPIILSGTTFSLAPSASAVVINGVSSQIPAPAASGPPIIQVGGQAFTADSLSNFVIGAQTLAAGGPAITVLNTPISLASSASFVVVGSATQTLAAAPAFAPAPALLTFGGQSVTADSSSNFVLGSQTLTPGGAIVVSGTPVSLAQSADFAVVGSNTQIIQPATHPSPVVLSLANGLSITANSASDFIIGSQTLTPGGLITIAGTPVSLAPSANFAVIGDSTQTLQPAATNPSPVVLSLANGLSVTANSASAFVIGSQTLTPGGVITIAGTPVSLAPSASFAVIGGSTQILQPAPTNAPAVLPLANGFITANSASAFVIGSQTLTPGGVITLSGTPISLAAAGSYVVVGTSTIPLATAAPSSAGRPSPEIFTFAGKTYTADAASDVFVIDGQTLSPGAAITVSGTQISLAVIPTDGAVGGGGSEGLASFILSGLGGGGGRAAETSVVAFEGKAARGRGPGSGWLGVKVMSFAAVVGAMLGGFVTLL